MQDGWSAAKYPLTGSLLILLVALAAPVAAQSADKACSSLFVKTDKDSYTLGEPVVISVSFTAQLPGCAEPMLAHDYLVVIQVFDVSNHAVYSTNHTTSGTISLATSWSPTIAGEYSINATSWFRLLGNEFMIRAMEASKLIDVQEATHPTAQEWGTAITTGTLAVVLVWILFKRRKRE